MSAESEYERLFNSVSEAIYIQDESGVFLDVNDAVVTMYGYDKSELIGQTPLMLADESRVDIPGTMRRVEKAFAGERQTFEWWGRRKSGEVFPKEVVLQSGTWKGRPVVIATARDITERKRSEEALRSAELREAESARLRALGQLAAGVAHDFNNALTSILGYAQVLQKRSSDDEMKKGLSVIEAAARGAAATVRRIQSFSRDRRNDEMLDVNLNDIVREAIEIARPRWQHDVQAAGIRYDVVLDVDRDPLVISANASELRDVFLNLIFNAVDAMPEGGEIRLRTQRRGSSAVVDVIDGGEGMDEETRARVFEPFFSTKGERGTGLGLAVSHGVVRRHGGQLTVLDSQPGVGSTLRVTLPRGEPTGQHPVLPERSARAAKVLLVDDDERVRSALEQLLIQLGHEVVAVGSGAEALRRLSERGFDLLLTDLSMPEMSGSALARAARKLVPTLPIVLMTGVVSELDARVAESHPVLAKPIDEAALDAAVARSLASRARK